MDRKRKDRVGAGEAAHLRDAGACEHQRGCGDCKLESRDLGAAGQLVVDWSRAIGFLVDRAKEDGDASKTGHFSPTYMAAIDGLAYAIGTVAEFDIVGETLSHRPQRPTSLEAVGRTS